MSVSGQRLAPPALYPQVKDTRYPLDKSGVGPKAGLDAEARGKSSASAENQSPVVQSVVRYYTNWAMVG
jgi:hypothetical protein